MISHPKLKAIIIRAALRHGSTPVGASNIACAVLNQLEEPSPKPLFEEIRKSLRNSLYWKDVMFVAEPLGLDRKIHEALDERGRGLATWLPNWILDAMTSGGEG